MAEQPGLQVEMKTRQSKKQAEKSGEKVKEDGPQLRPRQKRA